MSVKNTICTGVPQAITLQEVEGGESEAPKFLQILRTGKFNHPFFGKFEITEKKLNEMKSNFDANVVRTDLAMDFSHNSFAEAAGWFKGLDIRADGNQLWAEINWTKAGKEKVSDRQFRYTSSEFDPEFEDSETGQKSGMVLMGAALTNRPFIKSMAPTTQLSELTKGEQMTLEELEKQNNELKAKNEGLTKKLSDTKTSEAGKEAIELSDKLKKENKELKEKNVKLEEAKVLQGKTDAFNKLLTDGKACEAQREAFIAGDTVKFAELAGDVKLGKIGDGGDPPPTTKPDGKDVAAEITKLALAKVKDGECKNLMDANKVVLSENPELEKKYHEETKHMDYEPASN